MGRRDASESNPSTPHERLTTARAQDAYLCPLTLKVMRNPVVVTKTGRTYEKVAIEAWIALNRSEPYDARVRLTDFYEECSSNTALYALIDHFVRSVRTMEPGALLDGTVAQRMKRAAAKTTVVVVERNVHVFKKQASSLPADVDLKTLEKGLIPDVRRQKKKEGQEDVAGDVVFPEELPDRAYIHVTSLEFPDGSEPADGRFFRFDMDELTRVIGHDWVKDDSEAYKTENFSVKTGKGATFCTYRNETRSAVVVFAGPDGAGVGCYHPVASARPGDWVVNEPIELTSYRGIPKGLRFMDPSKIVSMKYQWDRIGDEGAILSSGMNGEREEQILPGQSGIYPLDVKYRGNRIYPWLQISVKLKYPTGTDPELINGRPITPIGLFVDNRLLLQRGGCVQVYNCRNNEPYHDEYNGDGPHFRGGMQTDDDNLQHFGALLFHRDRLYQSVTDFKFNVRMPDIGPSGVPCFSKEGGGGVHIGLLEGDPDWLKVGKNEWPTEREGNVGATCDDDASKWSDKSISGPNARDIDEFFVYNPNKKIPTKQRTYKTATGDTIVKKVKSDAFVFPRQRRKLVDPHLDVVSVDYPGDVMPGKEEPEPKGKWFRFKSEQLSEICGVSDWGDGNLEGWKTGIIKSGEGASFSVADRDRGVIVFQHKSGLGVGCSNPCDYARAGEWKVGDRLKLSAFSNENQPPPYTFAMSIDEYICQTETGWNLPGHLIRFGQCGLVGPWWKEMEIEFKIEEASVGTRIYGVHTDASYESLPFTAKALRSDGEWHDIELSTRSVPWGRAFASIMDDVSAVRVRWESTDLGKLANSTYRSGGGIHANLLGTSTAFNVLDVRHSGHPADGSIFRFDKDAIRAATCGVADWQGRYDVLNLRSGKKGEVMLLDEADAKVLEAYSKTLVKRMTAPEPAAPVAPVAPPSVVVVDTPAATRVPAQPQPQRSKGLFSCCFSDPAPPVAPSAYVDEPTATTMVVYKDVYIDEASPPEKPPKPVPSQASAAVDVLGFGYWVDDAKTPALAPGDWQIGDIVMLARADLDVDDVAPSVLEEGDRGVTALERVKSVAAAGDWANIRFILSEDVANIPLPNI